MRDYHFGKAYRTNLLPMYLYLILDIFENHFFSCNTLRIGVTTEYPATIVLGPVVQSPISANPGLTVQVLLRVNPGLALIGL